jgi:hypothetical protein
MYEYTSVISSGVEAASKENIPGKILPSSRLTLSLMMIICNPIISALPADSNRLPVAK